MKYKAIISDVDGTLIQQGSIFNKKGLPTPRVTKAIAKIQNKIHFGIATSRPLIGVSHIFDHLALSGPSILFGGSVIVDGKSKEVLWEKDLSSESVKAVLAIIAKHKIDFTVNEGNGEVIHNKKDYIPQNPRNIFLAELTEHKLEEIHDALKKIPDIAIHRTPSWNSKLWAFDVTHIEATKQHGILQVAEILTIHPSEIIGIGDGYNDFPLLMACGLKVAMGNAVEDLKAIADYIAPSVNEDGVADVIEKFIHF